MGRESKDLMPQDPILKDYTLQIVSKIAVPGAPSALKAMPLASPNVFLATTMSDENKVAILKSGMASLISEIQVGNGPFDVSRGSGVLAYVACRDDRTLDVIDRKARVARIDLPGTPYGLAWNGMFKRGKSRLLVACERANQKYGMLCVIDEETREIINTLQVGRNPRGIGLDRHHRFLFVANCGDDSISIIDQSGTHVLGTVPTAGRPIGVNNSWADKDHIIVSLDSGGVLQRVDASRQPPELSGLTALRRDNPAQSALLPSCCVSLGQDDLWVVPDRFSQSIALVVSSEKTFQQIDCFDLSDGRDDSHGFGELAIATPGLPGRFYVANTNRHELLLVRLEKHRLR